MSHSGNNSLPDEFVVSPKLESVAPKVVPELGLIEEKSVTQPVRASVPDGPPSPRGKANDNLLSSTSGIDVDEEYSKDEKLLNEFTKLHPMCSMESSSAKTMQLISGMLEKAHVEIPEIPVVSKTHDDQFLCPPNKSIGERECVCGDKCLSMFIARIRYGNDNPMGFVCKEFLLPDQYEQFRKGKGLPPQRQKCLLCSRYFVNYLYILARSDPSFTLNTPCISLQTFSNVFASALPEYGTIMDSAASTPNHANLVSCKGGYMPHAMLFVDEDFADLRCQRETKLAALSFKPIVRFCSSHYRYVKDKENPAENAYRIVQVGIGYDDNLGGLGFRQPPPLSARVGAASKA